MECSDTTALSSYVLVNDTLLVNESSPTEENGALYQSSAGNTKTRQAIWPVLFLHGIGWDLKPWPPSFAAAKTPQCRRF